MSIYKRRGNTQIVVDIMDDGSLGFQTLPVGETGRCFIFKLEWPMVRDIIKHALRARYARSRNV